ncbi:hypothetical protein SDRG_00996 [Saprolegnia diclina VS20]|uniref:Tudor domain-containing protein n=1 Tax=Saprolegnia diclina (strain VS20) TaxID=1156394 RepID=T0R5D7_SAPDV|nr:hypothetical protein SDRG_00996 [Saprolegnia diclina VS20]EQC42156.1 hypothetical protein SDRG_00996 [Saprolegnia diclina VS20]|eukprot:XP_008604725.1 hypothetical protein SDRG_00996 [Saprolegnia diclina VS20]
MMKKHATKTVGRATPSTAKAKARAAFSVGQLVDVAQETVGKWKRGKIMSLRQGAPTTSASKRRPENTSLQYDIAYENGQIECDIDADRLRPMAKEPASLYQAPPTTSPTSLSRPKATPSSSSTATKRTSLEGYGSHDETESGPPPMVLRTEEQLLGHQSQIQIVLDNLFSIHADVHSVKKALSTLLKLLRTAPQVTADYFHFKAGETILLHIIRSHSLYSVLQCYGFVLLRKMCHLSFESCHVFVQNGAVAAIAGALTSFPDDPIVQASGCGALAALGQLNVNSVAIMLEHNIVPLVTKAILSHLEINANTRQVQFYACEVLLELCDRGGARAAAAIVELQGDDGGLLKALVQVLRKSLKLDDKKVSCAICSLVLCLLSMNKATAQLLRQTDAISDLSIVMAKYPSHEGILKYSVLATRELAIASIQSPSNRVRQTARVILDDDKKASTATPKSRKPIKTPTPTAKGRATARSVPKKDRNVVTREKKLLETYGFDPASTPLGRKVKPSTAASALAPPTAKAAFAAPTVVTSTPLPSDPDILLTRPHSSSKLQPLVFDTLPTARPQTTTPTSGAKWSDKLTPRVPPAELKTLASELFQPKEDDGPRPSSSDASALNRISFADKLHRMIEKAETSLGTTAQVLPPATTPRPIESSRPTESVLPPATTPWPMPVSEVRPVTPASTLPEIVFGERGIFTPIANKQPVIELFPVGTKVRVRFNGGARYYPGVIAATYPDQRCYDIDYNDGEQESKVPIDWIRLQPTAGLVAALSPVKVRRIFHEGDCVEARPPGKTAFYPARVVHATSKFGATGYVYDIAYDSGEAASDVPQECLRPMVLPEWVFSLGQTVEARYKGRSKYYRGTVNKLRLTGHYDILYDDGEQEVNIHRDYIRAVVVLESYEDGDAVEAQAEGLQEYAPGVVTRCRLDGSYDVRFLAGNEETFIGPERIRRRKGGPLVQDVGDDPGPVPVELERPPPETVVSPRALKASAVTPLVPLLRPPTPRVEKSTDQDAPLSPTTHTDDGALPTPPEPSHLSVVASPSPEPSPTKQDDARSESPRKAVATFERHQRVQVRVNGSVQVETGVVLRCRLNGTYDIEFDTGEKEIGVPPDQIEPMTWPPQEYIPLWHLGDIIEARCRGRTRYIPGVIAQVHVEPTSARYDVHFENGVVQEHLDEDSIHLLRRCPDVTAVFAANARVAMDGQDGVIARCLTNGCYDVLLDVGTEVTMVPFQYLTPSTAPLPTPSALEAAQEAHPVLPSDDASADAPFLISETAATVVVDPSPKTADAAPDGDVSDASRVEGREAVEPEVTVADVNMPEKVPILSDTVDPSSLFASESNDEVADYSSTSVAGDDEPILVPEVVTAMSGPAVTDSAEAEPNEAPCTLDMAHELSASLTSSVLSAAVLGVGSPGAHDDVADEISETARDADGAAASTVTSSATAVVANAIGTAVSDITAEALRSSLVETTAAPCDVSDKSTRLFDDVIADAKDVVYLHDDATSVSNDHNADEKPTLLEADAKDSTDVWTSNQMDDVGEAVRISATAVAVGAIAIGAAVHACAVERPHDDVAVARGQATAHWASDTYDVASDSNEAVTSSKSIDAPETKDADLDPVHVNANAIEGSVDASGDGPLSELDMDVCCPSATEEAPVLALSDDPFALAMAINAVAETTCNDVLQTATTHVLDSWTPAPQDAVAADVNTDDYDFYAAGDECAPPEHATSDESAPQELVAAVASTEDFDFYATSDECAPPEMEETASAFEDEAASTEMQKNDVDLDHATPTSARDGASDHVVSLEHEAPEGNATDIALALEEEALRAATVHDLSVVVTTGMVALAVATATCASTSSTASTVALRTVATDDQPSADETLLASGNVPDDAVARQQEAAAIVPHELCAAVASDAVATALRTMASSTPLETTESCFVVETERTARIDHRSDGTPETLHATAAAAVNDAIHGAVDILTAQMHPNDDPPTGASKDKPESTNEDGHKSMLPADNPKSTKTSPRETLTLIARTDSAQVLQGDHETASSSQSAAALEPTTVVNVPDNTLRTLATAVVSEAIQAASESKDLVRLLDDAAYINDIKPTDASDSPRTIDDAVFEAKPTATSSRDDLFDKVQPYEADESKSSSLDALHALAATVTVTAIEAATKATLWDDAKANVETAPLTFDQATAAGDESLDHGAKDAVETANAKDVDDADTKGAPDDDKSTCGASTSREILHKSATDMVADTISVAMNWRTDELQRAELKMQSHDQLEHEAKISDDAKSPRVDHQGGTTMSTEAKEAEATSNTSEVAIEDSDSVGENDSVHETTPSIVMARAINSVAETTCSHAFQSATTHVAERQTLVHEEAFNLELRPQNVASCRHDAPHAAASVLAVQLASSGSEPDETTCEVITVVASTVVANAVDEGLQRSRPTTASGAHKTIRDLDDSTEAWSLPDSVVPAADVPPILDIAPLPLHKLECARSASTIAVDSLLQEGIARASAVFAASSELPPSSSDAPIKHAHIEPSTIPAAPSDESSSVAIKAADASKAFVPEKALDDLLLGLPKADAKAASDNKDKRTSYLSQERFDNQSESGQLDVPPVRVMLSHTVDSFVHDGVERAMQTMVNSSDESPTKNNLDASKEAPRRVQEPEDRPSVDDATLRMDHASESPRENQDEPTESSAPPSSFSTSTPFLPKP